MIRPYYVLPRCGRLAYLNIPKSACTSVLRALSELRESVDFHPPQHPLPDGSDAIHGFHPPDSHLDYFFSRWPLDYPALPAAFLRFTFVRDPYTRLYSFYKSKIVMGQNPGGYYTRLGINQGCSFEECVRRITEVNPDELEHHAAPQASILVRNGELTADFVGHVEKLSSDWEVICQLAGRSMTIGQHNRTASSDASPYTPELKAMVRAYYHDDFILFGYDTEMATPDLSGEVFNDHRLPQEQAQELRKLIQKRTDDVRAMAARFAAKPAARDEWLSGQQEHYRELLLKRIASLEEMASELTTNEGKVEHGSQPAIQALHQQGDALSQKISDLRSDIDTQHTVIQTLEHWKSSQGNQAQALSDRCDTHQNSLLNLQQEEEKLSQQISELGGNSDAQQAAIQALQHWKESQAVQVQELSNRDDLHQDSLLNLQQKEEDLSQQISELAGNSDTQQAAIQKLEHWKASQGILVEKLSDHYNAHQESLLTLQQQGESLRQQIVELSSNSKIQHSVGETHAERLLNLNSQSGELQRKFTRLDHLASELKSQQRQAVLTRYRYVRNRSFWLKAFFRHRRERAIINSAGQVDPAWYFETYPEAMAELRSAVDHYLVRGAGLGYDPSPGFSTIAYLLRHPDVTERGDNPLAHSISSSRSQPDSSVR